MPQPWMAIGWLSSIGLAGTRRIRHGPGYPELREAMRYWIRDKEKGSHGAPLRKLLHRVRAVSRAAAGQPGPGYQLTVNKARGQGARVDGLEGQLAQQRQVPVTFEQLDELSRSSEDWLSELEVECSGPAMGLRFGLHDGAALYVDAPRDITVAIVKPFKDIHPDPGWLGQRRP